MATLMRATRLFATVTALSVAGTLAASAQRAVTTTTTLSGFSLTRPDFTRPAGTPGAARSIAGNDQYMIAPAQPTDPVVLKKPKRR